MGEYAVRRSDGARIKIGTCENLYYLRHDQRDAVRPEVPLDNAVFRFRFPFPDEDNVAPGEFRNPFRTLGLYGLEVPEGVEHGGVQFVSERGFNTMLPCPEGPDGIPGLTVHRNGYAGPVRLVQQRVWEGRLVAVCECGGCGYKYRLPTFDDAEPLVVALRSYADQAARQNDSSRANYYNEVAARVTAGYFLEAAAS